MTSKTFFAAACVLAAAIAPSLASAATTDAMETNVAVVRTSDLNLSTPQGQATLNARIAGAVSRVCGSATGAISIEERRAISVCRAKARNTALAVARTREGQVLAQR
jgi:UrcA family protein